MAIDSRGGHDASANLTVMDIEHRQKSAPLRHPQREGRVPGKIALLAAAIAVATAAPTAAATGTPVPSKVGFELPRPTGPHPIGTTELHLVDRNRPDPFVKVPRSRELMVSVWYPTTRGGREPKAPYLRPNAAGYFDGGAPAFGLQPGQVDWAAVTTHARTGAPARGRHPVVFYSPGYGVPRALGTSQVEELASRGYVVVTVDHTYEAPMVEFPGGRLEVKIPYEGDKLAHMRLALATRRDDIRFVLDQLDVLRRGRNPDAGARRLPRGLGAALDLSRVGAFGHSYGGDTAAEAMHADRRIDAGVDMDGALAYDMAGEHLSAAGRDGLDRPFLLFGSAGSMPDGQPRTHLSAPAWRSFWERSTGWKLDLLVPEGMHHTYSDVQTILPQLDEKLHGPERVRAKMIGTVDPARIVAAQRAYLTAFFEQHLRRCPQPLLRGPSPEHPDVRFVI